MKEILRASGRVGHEFRFLLGETHARAVLGALGHDARIEFGVRYLGGKAIAIGDCVEILRDSTLDARSPLGAHRLVIGDHVRIKENVWLACYGGDIQIGDYALVGRNCVIHGHGGVSIGDWSMLGSNIMVVSANHVFWGAASDVPFQSRGFTLEPVTIGRNVWIGSNAVILGGVTIEADVVLGAGSVVTKSLAGGFVYAGVPAKPLRRIDAQESIDDVLLADPQLQRSHPVRASSRWVRLAKALLDR
jgi:acetyltransferase-like isoleucine patch superfamily enzyme